MLLPGADAYRRKQYDRVPGWFWPEDFDLFDRILHQQLADNIRGDLLEIGAYHGKSAILMGCGLRGDETLVVNDLFGLPVDTAEASDVFEPGFSRNTFLNNYRQVHDRDPVVHQCSSLKLDLPKGFRFVHVDGGHSQLVAAFDIGTAVDAASTNAVVAIDDYRTHHTPGVPAAIWAAAVCEELFPFALSETKVYACADKESHAYWLDVVRSWGFDGNEEHTIFGSTVVRTTRGRTRWN